MEEESAKKDETIKNLREEIDVANKKILEYSGQMKDAQENIETWKKENQKLHQEITDGTKKLSDMALQLNDAKKMHAESEEDILHLQRKLTTVLSESVLDSLEHAGAAKDEKTTLESLKRVLAPPSPMSPQDLSGSVCDEAVNDAGEQVSEFDKLKIEYSAQRQRLIKAKALHSEASAIITSLAESKKKADEELALFRELVEKYKRKDKWTSLRLRELEMSTPSLLPNKQMPSPLPIKQMAKEPPAEGMRLPVGDEERMSIFRKLSNLNINISDAKGEFTAQGGARAPCAPPLYPPMIEIHKHMDNFNRKEETLNLNQIWCPILRNARVAPMNNRDALPVRNAGVAPLSGHLPTTTTLSSSELPLGDQTIPDPSTSSELLRAGNGSVISQMIPGPAIPGGYGSTAYGISQLLQENDMMFGTTQDGFTLFSIVPQMPDNTEGSRSPDNTTQSTSPGKLQSQNTPKKGRSTFSVCDDVLLKLQRKLDEKPDEQEMTGQYFASKLRHLPRDVATLTEKLISDLLSQALLGNVTPLTRVNIFDTPHMYPRQSLH